jgi:hypothetical protein
MGRIRRRQGHFRMKQFMTHRLVRAARRCSSVLAALSLLAVAAPLISGPVRAQSGNAGICNQIRVELSSLGRQGGGSGAQVGRLRAELARTLNAIRQNECDRPHGFLGLGSAPPICGPLRAEAAQLQARLRQADVADPSSARRSQLIAAFQRYNCDGSQGPQRGVVYATPNQGSLFEQLFGGRTSSAVVDDQPAAREVDPVLEEELREKAKLGGRTPICVRTCDGFFFPVNFEGLTARDEHGDVCQALCPAAETQVMYMRLGADIETAATRDGRAYTAFPFALKYREQYDAACFCRPQGYTAAQIAKGQPDIVEARRGDLVVSQEQAAAMSRPKEFREAQTQRRANQRQQRQARTNAPGDPNAVEPATVPDSAIPTAGTASAGIGPQIGDQRVLGANQGLVQEIVGADGNKRQIRVVAPAPNAPEPPSAPAAATRPSIPAPARVP